MTRKDYRVIAQAIKETLDSGVTSGVLLRKVIDRLIEILSVELKINNSRFNSEKFKNYIYGK